jgi:hypothetical protein
MTPLETALAGWHIGYDDANERPAVLLLDLSTGPKAPPCESRCGGYDLLARLCFHRISISRARPGSVPQRSPGLLVMSKAGRQSQNLAFSGPGKQTLYMTAREGLYRVRMLSKGPDRLGK